MNTESMEKPQDFRVLAGKYLTFHLDNEEYGLEILKVKEIIGMQEITKIPGTSRYIRGVINLRGQVIPVVDLRRKFSMEELKITRKTCIIVVQVEKGKAGLVMGIIVDEVSEVVEISAEQIERPQCLGTTMNKQFILGMAKTESAVKILLDIDQVLSDEEVATLNRAV
jgi:purine-binding chemotaxis protein CheW